jgi:hypothetical protein
MFRHSTASRRLIAGAFVLFGFCLPVWCFQARADLQTGPALPSTNLGQPTAPPANPTTPKRPVKPPVTGPALPAPPPAPQEPPDQQTPVPPGSQQPGPQQTAPGAPAIPGLNGLMTPNGIALPGGVGFIKPGDDTVGIQINTPDGPFQITVPRRRRNGRRDGRDQGPQAPAATTDAPLFGQPSTPGASPAPQTSVPQASVPSSRIPEPGFENDRRLPLPGEANTPDSARPSRADREFTHDSKLFHARNYPLVLKRLDRALGREPDDRDLIQLRSLTELALGDFKAAFSDAMTVLAQDDVWGWSTLRSLFHSADEYTALYRKLEDRVIADPNAIQLRVLLAYHNLMLGHRDAARRHFEKVLALDPSNEVARRLVSAESPPLPRDSAQLPPAPATSSPPLTPIPTRRRPPTNGPSSSGGVSIDLGQPAAATNAPPHPAPPADARPN